ncbi:MAG: flagellar motor switch protein FliN [Deltaproteobacteria bacterium]|nr:flagellar motor switch protein FliN [Deltaproteobacteria bacterium]MBW2338804.1 flagellar motor switch protein FliN [Deltaproteobacteria bacterium]
MNDTDTVTDNGHKEAAQDNGKTGTAQGSEPGPHEKWDLDLILDIPLDVAVELGRVKMLVDDVLQLGQGSIIELDKPVGERLEIYVNEKLIARGEVVVANEKFGIRVTDIVSPVERVESLGS